jgi:hypothetical protein
MAQKLFSQDEAYLTRQASEALTGYRFVKLNASDTAKIDMADTAGEQVLGALDASWSSGDKAVRVVYRGITYVQAGGTVAADDYVCTDANGKAVKAGGTAAADYVAGRAMTAGVTGDLIAVDLLPGGGASIADVGAGHKFFVIPIAVVAATSENDTGYDLPAKSIVKNVWVDVTTAPTAGTTKLIDVGTDGSGSNDPNGWLAGVSIATLGLHKGTLLSTGQTLGALLSVNEDGSGALVPEPDIASGGESITYTYSAADIAGQAGNIVVEFVEVQ